MKPALSAMHFDPRSCLGWIWRLLARPLRGRRLESGGRSPCSGSHPATAMLRFTRGLSRRHQACRREGGCIARHGSPPAKATPRSVRGHGLACNCDLSAQHNAACDQGDQRSAGSLVLSAGMGGRFGSTSTGWFGQGRLVPPGLHGWWSQHIDAFPHRRSGDIDALNGSQSG